MNDKFAAEEIVAILLLLIVVTAHVVDAVSFTVGIIATAIIRDEVALRFNILV